MHLGKREMADTDCDFLGGQSRLMPPHDGSNGHACAANMRRAAFDARGAGDHAPDLHFGCCDVHGQKILDGVAAFNATVRRCNR